MSSFVFCSVTVNMAQILDDVHALRFLEEDIFRGAASCSEFVLS